jgi:tetratricopeptide (TPR) repeat protein
MAVRPAWLLATLLATTGAAAQTAVADPAAPLNPVAAVATDAGAPAAAPVYPPVQQEELYRAGLRALAEGRPEDAARLLSQFLEGEPLHAGAWLDLALSQCELGNADEAERLFQNIEQRFAPPPSILEVMASYRAQGCRLPVRPASWQVSLGRGRDTNVNQGTSTPTFTIGTGANQGELELSPEFLPQADNYSTWSGSYLRPLNNRGTLLILQGYGRRHDNLHDQDNLSLLAGLEQSWTLGRWRTRATGALGAAMLDGQLYQRQQQLQLRAVPPLPLPANLDLTLTTGINHITYPTRSSYDANTLELGAILSYRRQRDQLELSVTSLRDHALADRPGGDRRGWYGNLQWYTELGKGLYGEAGASLQHWLSDSVYSAGLIDTVRRQDTLSARAALQWYFRPGVSLYLEGRAVRNRENISLFQYNSRALQLSLRWDNF